MTKTQLVLQALKNAGKAGEKFVPIIGFPRYLISNFGRLYSVKTKKFIGAVNGNGYYCAKIWNDFESKHIEHHRLVAIHFLNKSSSKLEVNHKDGKKQNNRVDNLEWVTRSQNVQHSWDNGLQKFSDELKNKLRSIGLYSGKFLTEEVKKKMSKSHIGLPNYSLRKSIKQFGKNNNYIKTWNSITEAAKAHNISIQAISRCLNGKSNSSANSYWKYEI